MPKEQKVQSEEPMKTNWADDSPTSIGLVLGDVWVKWAFKKRCDIPCSYKISLINHADQKCLLDESMTRMLIMSHTILILNITFLHCRKKSETKKGYSHVI